MTSVIQFSKLLIHSSVSSSLLLILSSVFFISFIVFLTSDQLFFIFSSSVLKFSVCSSVLFPSSVSILITHALNFSFAESFILVSVIIFSGVLLLLFQWRQAPLPSHFPYLSIFMKLGQVVIRCCLCWSVPVASVSAQWLGWKSWM